MKHAIALTLVVTALGAAPVLSAEMGAEDLTTHQKFLHPGSLM
jgi:hypothetical protein